MRLFRMLCGKAQNPYKVPLAKPRLNFALRDKIRGKGAKKDMHQTLQHMQNLITKLAQNDYDQRFCTNEVKLMNDAMEKANQEFRIQKEENNSDRIKTGQNINAHQINKYLKKFPIYKPNPFEEKTKKQTDLPAYQQKYDE